MTACHLEVESERVEPSFENGNTERTLYGGLCTDRGSPAARGIAIVTAKHGVNVPLPKYRTLE